MRAGFRSPLLLLALVAPGQALAAGPLTRAHITRLRGATETPRPVVVELAQDPDVGEPPDPAHRAGVSVPSAGPAPDFGTVAVLAALDVARRQGLAAQAAEDEAALVLLLVLLEEGL